MQSRFRVIGAGVWGLAFSDYLIKLGHDVEIYRRNISLKAENIQKIGLTHITPNHIKPLNTLNDLQHDNEINIIAVNSKGFSNLLNDHENYFSRLTSLISLTKGIDHQSGKYFSDLVFDKFINMRKYGLISGPSFAKDLCDERTIAVSFASLDDDLSQSMCDKIKGASFKMIPIKYIYHIEIAGIIKNIAAIICGMADECFKKGVHTNKIIKKACEETWSQATEVWESLHGNGYKGIAHDLSHEKELIISSPGYIGDMILTCKQNQSRNYQFGKLIADTKISVEDAKQSIGTVEGYDCCQTLVEKSKYISNGLTKLLYDILKSRNSERERLLKEFLQA